MPHPVNEDTVPISELLALLDASVRCADAATSQLRFDVYDTQQRVVVGLWQAIIEYACAVAAVVRAGMLYAPAVLARSALDAYVDRVNAIATTATIWQRRIRGHGGRCSRERVAAGIPTLLR